MTLLACLLYMAVHELTHGITLPALTGTKPTYSMRFPFLTTSSSFYLTRRSTTVITLAPCIIFGLVLFLVLAEFVLMIYILLALNFAGSAGDYVEAGLALGQPKNALLRDEGNRFHAFIPGLAPDS